MSERCWICEEKAEFVFHPVTGDDRFYCKKCHKKHVKKNVADEIQEDSE